MKKPPFTFTVAIAALLFSAILVLAAGCTPRESPEVQAMKAKMKEMEDMHAAVEKNLATFDTLDFVVFTNQEWTRLHESHAKDIKVHWPDGHMTEGIDVHIEDLKALFVYAPDTRIRVHPIRFGSGNMTAVTGVFEGTFTKPMPIGGGKFIQPTGKAFKLPMCTIGIWGPEGTMTEEHLFWDNQTFMKQVGLAR